MEEGIYISKFDNKTEVYLKTSDQVFYPTATSDFLINAVASNIDFVDNLLDLGCGNGIVGLTLFKLKKAKDILFSDLSEEAIDITIENMQLNNCKGAALGSDIFSNIDNITFDVIVDDISGISEGVAHLSNWFNNVPCDSGIDGCKNIEKVLNQSSKYIKRNGKIFFPVISLSNTNKIIKLAENNFKNLIKISHDKWFLPDEFFNHISILERLKKDGNIDYCEKFGKLICWTDIYVAF